MNREKKEYLESFFNGEVEHSFNARDAITKEFDSFVNELEKSRNPLDVAFYNSLDANIRDNLAAKFLFDEEAKKHFENLAIAKFLEMEKSLKENKLTLIASGKYLEKQKELEIYQKSIPSIINNLCYDLRQLEICNHKASKVKALKESLEAIKRTVKTAINESMEDFLQ